MFEQLLREAEAQGVEVVTPPLAGNIKGLYCDNVIAINQNIQTTAEKTSVLAEELGHHYTSCGHIIDTRSVNNVKQEWRARIWAFERLVSLPRLVEASYKGISTRYELSEYLDVPEWFLVQALSYYKSKYGVSCRIGDHIVYFDPLMVKRRV